MIPASAVGPRVGERVDQLLALACGVSGVMPVLGERVQQLTEALDLLRGRARLQQRDLDRLGDPEVRGGARPEPGRDPRSPLGRLERRDEGVAEDGERPPLGVA